MPEIDIGSFCKLSYKDRDLWWPNKYRVACFSHFIAAKVKKILRKSQPQIREKLRKLSLMEKACMAFAVIMNYKEINLFSRSVFPAIT